MNKKFISICIKYLSFIPKTNCTLWKEILSAAITRWFLEGFIRRGNSSYLIQVCWGKNQNKVNSVKNKNEDFSSICSQKVLAYMVHIYLFLYKRSCFLKRSAQLIQTCILRPNLCIDFLGKVCRAWCLLKQTNIITTEPEESLLFSRGLSS